MKSRLFSEWSFTPGPTHTHTYIHTHVSAITHTLTHTHIGLLEEAFLDRLCVCVCVCVLGWVPLFLLGCLCGVFLCSRLLLQQRPTAPAYARAPIALLVLIMSVIVLLRLLLSSILTAVSAVTLPTHDRLTPISSSPRPAGATWNRKPSFSFSVL